MAQKKQDSSSGVVKGLGLLAGAAAVAGAGYYFYASKDATKNRKIAAKWATNMKADVVKMAKKAQKLDRKTIHEIIGQTQKMYQAAKNINQEEVMLVAKELKSNWEQLAGELGKDTAVAKKAITKTVATGVKSVQKTAKKVAKKVSK